VESQQVAELLARYSYLGVLGLLCAAGVGAPVSEDLLLIAGGMVIGQGGGSLPLMIAIGWVGTVAGDALLFRIGKHLGPRAARQRHLSRVLTPARVERVREYYVRYGMLTVAVIRFIPGLRATTILIAGSSGLSFRKFVIADGLAAMVTAPLLVWLGYRFGSVVLRDVTDVGRAMLIVALGALVAVIVVRAIRQWRSRRTVSG
jgi:membrane protein DedA with SNARE-associated domain